jgi:hypothetical protein
MSALQAKLSPGRPFFLPLDRQSPGTSSMSSPHGWLTGELASNLLRVWVRAVAGATLSAMFGTSGVRALHRRKQRNGHPEQGDPAQSPAPSRAANLASATDTQISVPGSTRLI